MIYIWRVHPDGTWDVVKKKMLRGARGGLALALVRDIERVQSRILALIPAAKSDMLLRHYLPDVSAHIKECYMETPMPDFEDETREEQEEYERNTPPDPDNRTGPDHTCEEAVRQEERELQRIIAAQTLAGDRMANTIYNEKMGICSNTEECECRHCVPIKEKYEENNHAE